MGVPLRIGTLDASGMCVNTHFGDIVNIGTSTPGAVQGYAKGSLFINASTGAIYRNNGSKASASFQRIAITTDDVALDATALEINRVADVSSRNVNCTASTLAVTEALHDGKTITLNRAAGIAVSLPALVTGAKFRFIVETTFTGAASISSVSNSDTMVGHALMGNDTNNNVVDWQATASDTYNTIDLLGTANSTGGIAGQVITIEGMTRNWFVEIRGDAAGTEVTPFIAT